MKRKAFTASRSWSPGSRPPSCLMRSDASGESGFGVCVLNLHIHGCWRPGLAPMIKHDMHFKETLPYAVAATLLAPLLPGHVFAVSSDNAATVFRLLAGSSNNPLVQRLLRLIMKQCTKHNITNIGDWNDREQPDAVHADKLSKTFSPEDWECIRTTNKSNKQSWVIDIVIHDIVTGHAVTAAFRVPLMK